MESFTLKYKGGASIKKPVHVGVVGSGNLEIIFEPVNNEELSFNVLTSSDGFKTTWNEVFERFAEQYKISANVIINDFGATPGVVRLRLAQAMELLKLNE